VREPTPEDRAKARYANDSGANVVIGHHPHIVQPLEIYRGRPIFYSVGNFVLGSGNSRAEGIAVGFQFEHDKTVVAIFPLFVKNSDPRIAYHPKVMTGMSADRALENLGEISGVSGPQLKKKGDWRVVVLAHADKSD
jgi:poly-gamma-glutamate capsule biosynthesis protein CapA/YwtB (metallophosphatase superfamily)